MENKWIKVILHASTFFAPYLIPILFMLLIDDKRVKSLAIQAVIFQFIMTVLITISTVLSFVLIGLPFLLVFGVMAIVIPIIGIVKALQDEDWNYPIIGNWV